MYFGDQYPAVLFYSEELDAGGKAYICIHIHGLSEVASSQLKLYKW